MSLDSLETNFEALRGTMLTDAGLDGLQEFEQTLPTHMVIEEAFTADCADKIRCVNNLATDRRSVESRQVENLVRCLGQVTKKGIEGPRWTQAFWQDRSLSIEPHVDFEQGNTVLGFFWVLGTPTFDIYTNVASEPQPWAGMHPTITHKVSISRVKPLSIPMLSRQMVILNGAALAGEQNINGHVSTGRASLPHAANVVAPHDRRSRLMVFGGNLKGSKKMLPGSD